MIEIYWWIIISLTFTHFCFNNLSFLIDVSSIDAKTQKLFVENGYKNWHLLFTYLSICITIIISSPFKSYTSHLRTQNNQDKDFVSENKFTATVNINGK